MKKTSGPLVLALILTAGFGSVSLGEELSAVAEKAGAAESVHGESDRPITVAEARGRARLLHETIHATLHVVHHQYYRDDTGVQIPALTMEAVFKELQRSRNVNLRWIAVDAQAMSVDHNPRDDFEKSAVRALAAGDGEFQRVEDGVYRYAGPITLSNQCLKCHVPNRTDTEARTAGLVIGMPVEVKHLSDSSVHDSDGQAP